MKNPKTYYPLVAATALIGVGIVPMSFGDEGQSFQPFEASQKSIPAEVDPLRKMIHAEVVQPLMQMAKMRSRFSRMGPTHSTSYHLAETTAKDSNGTRNFTVKRTVTPLFSKGTPPEAKSTEYLKLRHLANTEELQVDLKGKWVALGDHPILKALTKLPAQNKITP